MGDRRWEIGDREKVSEMGVRRWLVGDGTNGAWDCRLGSVLSGDVPCSFNLRCDSGTAVSAVFSPTTYLARSIYEEPPCEHVALPSRQCSLRQRTLLVQFTEEPPCEHVALPSRQCSLRRRTLLVQFTKNLCATRGTAILSGDVPCSFNLRRTSVRLVALPCSFNLRRTSVRAAWHCRLGSVLNVPCSFNLRRTSVRHVALPSRQCSLPTTYLARSIYDNLCASTWHCRLGSVFSTLLVQFTKNLCASTWHCRLGSVLSDNVRRSCSFNLRRTSVRAYVFNLRRTSVRHVALPSRQCSLRRRTLLVQFTTKPLCEHVALPSRQCSLRRRTLLVQFTTNLCASAWHCRLGSVLSGDVPCSFNLRRTSVRARGTAVSAVFSPTTYLARSIYEEPPCDTWHCRLGSVLSGDVPCSFNLRRTSVRHVALPSRQCSLRRRTLLVQFTTNLCASTWHCRLGSVLSGDVPCSFNLR